MIRCNFAQLARIVGCVCFLSTSAHTASAAEYPPQFEDATEHTYKSVDGVDLKLWVFSPANHQPEDRRSVAIFFFGGGWKGGNPEQFAQQCRYLAARGMVGITADYRVRSRHETLADRCVADAKSAIRWVRSHAGELGIDPDRLVAGGGSAGGHVAACTAILTTLDEPGEDRNVSSTPNACALFNPALLIAPYEDVTLESEKIAEMPTRTGVPPEQLSPIHNVRGGLPPMIVFHGVDDPTVPFQTIEKFRDVTRKAGNMFDLRGYEGQVHGFFNYGRGGTPGEYFAKTLHAMDGFLCDLGYLTGEPSVAIAKSRNVHVRSSLDNSLAAIEQDKSATVAFMGGSITEMEGYRPMVMRHLTETYPDTKFDFINAGISSTCSTTGAFRVNRDVLRHEPDLVFVEFAVNDDQDAAHASRECIRGMEGIVRRIRTDSPATDIVLTHFVNPEMLALSQNGRLPVSIAAHERVAQQYGLVSVNLAAEVADRISDGSLTWETYGGTHPKKPGNRLAADLNIDALTTAWANARRHMWQSSASRPPKAIDENGYSRGRFIEVSDVNLELGFQASKPDWTALPGSSRKRYEQETLLCADKPGASVSVSFKGNAVGAFVLAGPDAGSVEVSIDGGPEKKIDLYHRFSKGLHYPRTVMFATDLEPGEHQLELRIAEHSNPASVGHAVRVLSFVANGAN
tara:strand:+ start:16580 stop:18634 length:2055 start_codon:yes stop_codon:yes gene_type:complete